MTANDPEVAAIAAICTAMEGLESAAARQRVLNFAMSKFDLKPPSSPQKAAGESVDGDSEERDLFSRFDHDKPYENVWLLTADHYSRHGTEPFSVGELNARADSAGLVVPARVDKTLEGAGKGGKRYYQRIASGKYRITVHGEAFLRAAYGVKKGTVHSSSSAAADTSGQ